MDSPYIPSYGRGGTQPADDIGNLDRHASVENLKELQKYSERLQFEATCVRLWAEGIQNQIMDEQENVQIWISGMTDELIRLKRPNLHGSINCRLKVVHQPLRHPWEHLPFSSTSKRHPMQLELSQSSQLRCQAMHPWHLRPRTLHFHQEWVLIHGLTQ